MPRFLLISWFFILAAGFSPADEIKYQDGRVIKGVKVLKMRLDLYGKPIINIEKEGLFRQEREIVEFTIRSDFPTPTPTMISIRVLFPTATPRPTPPPPTPDPNGNFRGSRWGATKGDVYWTEKGRLFADIFLSKSLSVGIFHDALLGKPCEIGYFFVDGMLVASMYEIKTHGMDSDEVKDHYDLLLNALEQKYGRAKSDEYWNLFSSSMPSTSWADQKTDISISTVNRKNRIIIRIDYTGREYDGLAAAAYEELQKASFLELLDF